MASPPLTPPPPSGSSQGPRGHCRRQEGLHSGSPSGKHSTRRKAPVPHPLPRPPSTPGRGGGVSLHLRQEISAASWSPAPPAHSPASPFRGFAFGGPGLPPTPPFISGETMRRWRPESRSEIQQTRLHRGQSFLPVTRSYQVLILFRTRHHALPWRRDWEGTTVKAAIQTRGLRTQNSESHSHRGSGKASGR